MIKLQVGKKYKNRKGEIRTIDRSRGGSYPYVSGGLAFTEDGLFYKGEINEEDLIEEVIDPPAPLTELPEKFVIRRVNDTISRVIQEHFFKNGIYWCTGQQDYLNAGDKFISYGYDRAGVLTQGCNDKDLPVISLEDFLSLPLRKKISLELTPGYVAVVEKDKVVVDNIEVSFDIVRKIHAALEKEESPKGFAIWVPSQKLYDAVLEKMRTIAAKENFTAFSGLGTYLFYNHDGGGKAIDSGTKSSANKNTPIIEISKLWEEKPAVNIKINRAYTAVIKDGVAAVGCQNFSAAKIQELVKLLPA